MKIIKTWNLFNEKVDTITFDVYGCKSEDDFKAHKFELIDDDIASKSVAISLAMDTLDAGDYPIVKVLAEDGSFQKIYRK